MSLCAPDLFRNERDLSGADPLSHETTAKSDRPEFRKEREMTSGFAEVTQDHRKF